MARWVMLLVVIVFTELATSWYTFHRSNHAPAPVPVQVKVVHTVNGNHRLSPVGRKRAESKQPVLALLNPHDIHR